MAASVLFEKLGIVVLSDECLLVPVLDCNAQKKKLHQIEQHYELG